MRGLLLLVGTTIVAGTAYLFLLGCGGAGGGVAGNGFYAARYNGGVPLTIVNNASEAVCFVRMGPASDPNWGDNWLRPGEMVAPGAERAFSIVGGPWDVRVQNCEGGTMNQRMAVPIQGPARLDVASMTLAPGTPAAAVPTGPTRSTTGTGEGLYSN